MNTSSPDVAATTVPGETESTFASRDQVFDYNSSTFRIRQHLVVFSTKNFSPLVQQFLDYLRSRNTSATTPIKSYGADLIQFGQFLLPARSAHRSRRLSRRATRSTRSRSPSSR